MAQESITQKLTASEQSSNRFDHDVPLVVTTLFGFEGKPTLLEDVVQRFRLERSDESETVIVLEDLECGHDLVERWTVDFTDVEALFCVFGSHRFVVRFPLSWVLV